jgi:hypothetical protein
MRTRNEVALRGHEKTTRSLSLVLYSVCLHWDGVGGLWAGGWLVWLSIVKLRGMNSNSMYH